MYLMAIVLQRLLRSEWRRMSPDGGRSAPVGARGALGGNRSRVSCRCCAILTCAASRYSLPAFPRQHSEQPEMVEQNSSGWPSARVFASLDVNAILVFITQLALTGFIATRLGVIASRFRSSWSRPHGVCRVRHLQRDGGGHGGAGVNTLSSARREMLFSKVDREQVQGENVCDVASTALPTPVRRSSCSMRSAWAAWPRR